MTSKRFTFNLWDLKHFSIYCLTILSAYFLANTTGVSEYLIKDVWMSPESVWVAISLISIFAKKFVQEKK